MHRGKLIVLTAPLTESIDHAGYFIQMSMASLPMWLEGILNKKYPRWRDVEYNPDYTSIFGSSRQPINSHYARELFATIKAGPYRDRFRVIVGGSGG